MQENINRHIISGVLGIVSAVAIWLFGKAAVSFARRSNSTNPAELNRRRDTAMAQDFSITTDAFDRSLELLAQQAGRARRAAVTSKEKTPAGQFSLKTRAEKLEQLFENSLAAKLQAKINTDAPTSDALVDSYITQEADFIKSQCAHYRSIYNEEASSRETKGVSR